VSRLSPFRGAGFAVAIAAIVLIAAFLIASLPWMSNCRTNQKVSGAVVKEVRFAVSTQEMVVRFEMTSIERTKSRRRITMSIT